MDNFELIAILLVSHGSSGSHLLFKYPFANNNNQNNSQELKKYKNKKSPYSVVTTDTKDWIIEKEQNLITNGLLSGLNNDVLAALCVMNKDKLELKIDNVFFLSSQSILKTSQANFNVVFAVRSPLPRPVIRCYQSLSLSIAKSLMKEESNSDYLSSQSKLLNDLCEHQNVNDNNKSGDSVFAVAFQKSTLAKEFEKIYEGIREDGIVDLFINNCTKLSFCLPHLAYKIAEKCEQTHFVETIFDAVKYLKPYFGFILLTSRETLLDSLPINCNFYTHRLIEIYNPRFCLARYASELDVPINEVYAIVDHLIYWAKIKIVYPITETNVYVINSNAKIFIGSKLNEDFNEAFKGYSFHMILSDLSEAKPLVDHLDPEQPREKHIVFIDMILWFLQRNAIIQLHSFIYLLPRKIEHQRLACEQYSKVSDLSFDEENELSIASMIAVVNGTGPGSEHSNDTENTEQKDLSVIYDEYRELFSEFNVSEKDQQYIFKAFEQKSEQDIKLFVQLMPYYNGLSNLEAIMYYEQLNKSALFTFLDKFKDLLVVSVYEDPNPLIRINSKLN